MDTAGQLLFQTGVSKLDTDRRHRGFRWLHERPKPRDSKLGGAVSSNKMGGGVESRHAQAQWIIQVIRFGKRDIIHNRPQPE